MPWVDAEVEVAVGREKDLVALGLVVVDGVGTRVALTASGYLASWPALWQDAEDAEGAGSGTVADRSPAVEVAASAPALQLEDGRTTDLARKRTLVEEVDRYAVDGQVGRDWSLSGGGVGEGAAADVALDVVRFEKTDAISPEAVEKDLVGNAASHHSAWAASLAACCVSHVADLGGAVGQGVAAAVASSDGGLVCLSRLLLHPLLRLRHPRRRHLPCRRSPAGLCVRARRHTVEALVSGR
jgi:hypothetical protein